MQKHCRDSLCQIRLNYTCDINTITNTSLVGQAGITSPFGMVVVAAVALHAMMSHWATGPTQKSWRLTLTNSSLFMPGTPVKCEWNWGDGVIETFQPSDAQCQNGTKVFHQYTAKLPVGTKVKYVVKLTIFINNGTSSPPRIPFGGLLPTAYRRTPSQWAGLTTIVQVICGENADAPFEVGRSPRV